MCLRINKSKHLCFGKFILPKIALKPIFVKKQLDKVDDRYVTPCMRQYVYFKNGIAIQQAKFKRDDDVVAAGIHSSDLCSLLCFGEYEKWAYIPVGALYYIGMYGDFVSTKLVILEW